MVSVLVQALIIITQKKDLSSGGGKLTPKGWKTLENEVSIYSYLDFKFDILIIDCGRSRSISPTLMCTRARPSTRAFARATRPSYGAICNKRKRLQRAMEDSVVRLTVSSLIAKPVCGLTVVHVDCD
jgi:hypothetical protein